MSSNSTANANRLPFYKAPQQKPNLYQFEKKDIENSPVVKRFEKRPAVVPQVTEGSRANQAGIKLGDSIVKINNTDTSDMSLNEASKRIQESGGDIKLTVKNFEEDESKNNQEHEVQLAKKNKNEIDRDECWIPQPERKVWHPIVWQQPPPPVRSDQPGQEAPHKRLIRNIHRFFRETENNPAARQKQIEEMLLALPTISKDN